MSAAAVATGADLVLEGSKRFQARCAGCHGADGLGGERAPGIGEVDRSRLQSDEAILHLIRRGNPEAGMPAFDLNEAELAALTAFVRSRVKPANEVDVPGDRKLGQEFFLGNGGCAECHMIRGWGGLKGPDLTGIDERLTLAEIEQTLRDPNARRVPGFSAASVTLQSGGTVKGFIKNESAIDLQLQGFDGRFYLLWKAEIVQIERDTKSVMPPLTASPEQKQNLLAFLAHPSPGAASSGIRELAKLPEAVKWTDIADPKEGEWPTYHGLLSGNRYSSLQQITPENVDRLAPSWMFSIPGSAALQVTPLVVNGVMYVTTVNQVNALDAATGRQIWKYSRPRSKKLAGDAAGGINRGVAILGDRVFVVTDNAHLLALHRLTGGLLWDVEMADSRVNYGATSAPLVVGDLVISGVSGGDEGVRGFLSAYKASTGERVWQFWTVPLPGEPLARTWVGRAIEHGCASTWLTGTYDVETHLLFWPVGNPCPDFNGDERKGDNLYSDSILALRPETGKLEWYYQFTPHDLHDWDAAQTPMLVDTDYNGRPRQLLVQGNRNGFFYVLDRTNGTLLSAKPFVKRLTWATGIGADGRPILADGWEPTVEGTRVCPSMDGATNWMSTSYNPGTGFFYLMALEKCNVFSKSSEWWKVGEEFYGGGVRAVRDETPKKYLRAIDLQSGAIAWEYAQTGLADSWGGILSTASGLVFLGDDDGGVTILEAKTGKLLWHFGLNQPLRASPMTYMAGGKQYIAIAAGPNIVAFALR